MHCCDMEFSYSGTSRTMASLSHWPTLQQNWKSSTRQFFLQALADIITTDTLKGQLGCICLFHTPCSYMPLFTGLKSRTLSCGLLWLWNMQSFCGITCQMNIQVCLLWMSLQEQGGQFANITTYMSLGVLPMSSTSDFLTATKFPSGLLVLVAASLWVCLRVMHRMFRLF